MSRLFISHCTRDEESVRKFVEFLVLGMGVPHSDIFFTSQNGVLPAGQSFIENIRRAISNCQQVICFLTPNYLNSKFCLAELGAAWLQVNKILPLLAWPLQFDDLNDTPLLGLQMLRQEKPEDLMTLYDKLCILDIAKGGQTAAFSRHLNRYVRSLQQPQLITPDADGYYCVKIAAVRHTPPQYRCYKLEKLLRLQKPPLPGESHWVFYKGGMYEGLAVGDTIKLLVGSTELRDFPDLKCARNIYPDDLQKLCIRS